MVNLFGFIKSDDHVASASSEQCPDILKGCFTVLSG